MKLIRTNTEAIVKISNDIELSYKEDRREVENFSLSLDRDASAKSPAVLFNKLHMARENSNRAGILYMKYLKFFLFAKKLSKAKELQKRDEMDKAFKLNQEEYLKLRSSEDKNRFLESFLDEDLKESFRAAQVLMEEAGGYLAYFKLNHAMIDNFKGDILTQLGIIKSMITLGELNIVNDLPYSGEEVDVDKVNTPLNIDEGLIAL